MSEDELEPVEADPVEADPVAEEAGEAVGAASAGVAEVAEATALSDRDGQRLISTQTVQHDYLTLNGKVARETITVDGTVTTVMDFIYDESGRPFALKYSDDGGESFDTYYYVLNLQGDVVKLVWYIPGFEYKAVATYTYDAWGNVLTATGELAEINPLRYRGYYFDSETGFYYIKSRYYDPVQHRYLNADTVFDYDVGFPGYNLYAYCGNSPVFRIDVNGRDSEPADDHEELLNNAVVDNAAPSPPTPGFEGGYGGGGSCSGAAPTVEEDEDLRDVNDYIKAKNARNTNTRSGSRQSATSGPSAPVQISKKKLKFVDVHSLKEGFVGRNGASWDLFKDTSNNSAIWLGDKPRKVWIDTGFYLDKLETLFPLE